MSAREIPDQKAIAREMLVGQAAHAKSAVSVTNLIPILRHLEVIAKRESPRIAIKAKGRIIFLDLAEIVAVQAEGNYVSLLHRSSTYLLRGSLVHGGETQALRFYSHPPLGGREYFGRGGGPAVTDGRVQAACKRWEGISGNAYIQTQPQRSGSTVGRL